SVGCFLSVADLQSGLHSSQPFYDAAQFFFAAKLAGEAVKACFDTIEPPLHSSREFLIAALRPLIYPVNLLLDSPQARFYHTQPGLNLAEIRGYEAFNRSFDVVVYAHNFVHCTAMEA